MTFPRYANYKPSGVEWLGEVPGHWEMFRMASLFRDVNEPGNDDLPVLSVSIHDGVSDKELDENEMDRKVTRSDDRSKYKSVIPGDLTYNMMRAWQGGFGTVSAYGMVSPAYVVARPVRPFMTFFVEMILRTPNAVAEMKRHSRGVTDFRLRLYWEDFKCIEIALPPADEQAVIVDFIRHETSKIDALIAEQERLIALLAEKRQATISQAVTRGLNPDAPMKDSGVAWLGAVPAHWDVRPLKHLVSFRSGGTPSKEKLNYWNGDVPWASAKDLKTDRLTDTIDHISAAAIEEKAADLVPRGAVLVVVRGMILARMFPVSIVDTPMAINQDLKAVIPSERIGSEFLAWLLRGTSDDSLRRLDEAGHGTKALRMEAWASMLLPVPSIQEQALIAEFIEQEMARLAQLQHEAERAIALLKERRAALIAAAVTGQIDVRQAVAAATI